MDPADDISDREPPLLLGDPGVEDHLKEEVPELLGEIRVGARLDGPDNLVGLFDEVRSEGFVGLLPVPGASPFRPEVGHDPNQIFKRPGPGHFSVSFRDPRAYIQCIRRHTHYTGFFRRRKKKHELYDILYIFRKKPQYVVFTP